MTTIMPNAFSIGSVTKNIKKALKEVDTCLYALKDEIDRSKLRNARTRLVAALEEIDSLLKKADQG